MKRRGGGGPRAKASVRRAPARGARLEPERKEEHKVTKGQRAIYLQGSLYLMYLSYLHYMDDGYACNKAIICQAALNARVTLPIIARWARHYG